VNADTDIRQIQEGDIPDFHLLLDRVAREKKYLAMVQAPSIERTREFVLGNIRDGHAQYVAEQRGELVGWADIMPGQHESTRHMGGLGMGVAQGHRGRGIGRRLLARVIEHCWNAGLKRIELEVFVDNLPAIALYESMGFAHEGRLRCARLIDGEYRDVFHMALLHTDLTEECRG
jgi:RimJ/RimL family protein N-acetyltransferase